MLIIIEGDCIESIDEVSLILESIELIEKQVILFSILLFDSKLMLIDSLIRLSNLSLKIFWISPILN